jgi:hypothetical protein
MENPLCAARFAVRVERARQRPPAVATCEVARGREDEKMRKLAFACAAAVALAAVSVLLVHPSQAQTKKLWQGFAEELGKIGAPPPAPAKAAPAKPPAKAEPMKAVPAK